MNNFQRYKDTIYDMIAKQNGDYPAIMGGLPAICGPTYVDQCESCDLLSEAEHLEFPRDCPEDAACTISFLEWCMEENEDNHETPVTRNFHKYKNECVEIIKRQAGCIPAIIDDKPYYCLMHDNEARMTCAVCHLGQINSIYCTFAFLEWCSEKWHSTD